MAAAKNIPLLKVCMPTSAGEALRPVLASGYLADGAQVKAFEESLARELGEKHLTAMSDISGAITMALFMAGVRAGDDVMTSAMSCVATTMPIANLGARPVWCDVDPDTGMLDPTRMREAMTPKTKAVLYYHWGGDVANAEKIAAEARALGIRTVADCSDALGAELNGKPLGRSHADFAAYSFQAVKHLTTGEGGALVFARAEDADQAQWLKRYGIHRPSFKQPNGDLNDKSDIPVAGFNFYMNNIAATIGGEQFAAWPDLQARRRSNGEFFDRSLQNIDGVKLAERTPNSRSAYWTYSFLAERRGDLIAHLKERGIASQRLHVRNDIYSCFAASRGRDLPGTTRFHDRTISIPCGWWVTDEDREFIVSALRSGW